MILPASAAFSERMGCEGRGGLGLASRTYARDFKSARVSRLWRSDRIAGRNRAELGRPRPAARDFQFRVQGWR